jgi:hypothetical protein
MEIDNQLMLFLNLDRSRCRRFRLFIATMSLLLIGITQNAWPGRELPEDNLATPVLIQRSNGSGSGFYINDQKHLFLVTAAHVLLNSSGQLKSQFIQCVSYPREGFSVGRNVLWLDLQELQTAGLIKFRRSFDVVVIEIGTVSSDKPVFKVFLLTGVKTLEKAGEGLTAVDIGNTRPFKDVLIGNDVFVFGYPRSLGLLEHPQLDYLKPLLRKGVIAGKNDSLGSMILDLSVYPGNSGGPVIEVERAGIAVYYRVIGLVTQYIPFDPRRNESGEKKQDFINEQNDAATTRAEDVLHNSSYAVAIPIDHVLDLISDFH